MTPEWLSEKISSFKNINMLHIALKQMIWKFRIYNYFREIVKFRDCMVTINFFAKSLKHS